MARPNFLKGVTVSRGAKKNYETQGSNWLSLSEVISKLTEEQCLEYIILEMEGEKRSHILDRLKSRFNRLRNTREKQELFSETYK